VVKTSVKKVLSTPVSFEFGPLLLQAPVRQCFSLVDQNPPALLKKRLLHLLCLEVRTPLLVSHP